MDRDYLNIIYKYYNEKNSNKDCKGCKSEKIFEEKNDRIIYSCGGSNDKNCGIQLDIELPEYFNYKNLSDIKRYINEKINTKILSKYINIPIDDNKSETEYISKINKLFDGQNNMISKKELLNDIVLKRKRLYSELDINDKKKYVKKMIEINKLYKELLEIINHITDIIITIEPKILKNNITASAITNTIDLKVKWKEKNENKYGIVNKIMKDKFYIDSDVGEYILKKDKVEIISEDEYENAINNKSLNDIGDRVSWMNKSKIQMSGELIDINKLNGIVRTDDNDEYIIPLSKFIKKKHE